MKLKTVIALLFFITSSSLLFAQKPPMKFGQIDINNLKMTHYEKDSSVSAMVLYDYGNARIEYSNSTGSFQVIYDHHIRIKIFNKAGYEWADAKEYLYHDNSDKEKLSQLKGITYNLENGKVVKTKLSNKSVFEEKYDANNDVQKFTMPNVKEGSIIEYSYKITSDFTFNFQSWTFQKSIPVMWSEFITAIPEYFYYQKVFQGYLPYEVNTRDSRAKRFTLKVRTRPDVSTSSLNQSSQRSTVQTSDINYTENTDRWVVKNAPAFVAEPYITTSRNYVSKVRFELATTKFPNQMVNNVMGTWEKLNEQFLKSDYFGKRVVGSGFLKKEVENIIANEPDDNGKISAIYNYVKENVSWDGRYRRFLDYNLKNPFDDKKGSSSEVNLMLTSMLQKAGFNADPVLISTRNNGIVRTDLPISDQFNYVICKLNLDDKYILLDATDPYLPLDMLPQRCLNGKGWVVSKTNSGWVNLSTNKKASTQISGDLEISDDGDLSGDLAYKYGGYESRSPRKKYFQDGEDKFIEDKVSTSSWEVEDLALVDASDISSAFVEKYTIEEMGGAENLGGKIYLDPVVSGSWDENPFKLESREYPVDFAFPLAQKYYVNFIIPEGYIVEETPQPLAMVLPEKGGKFVFRVSVAGNKVTVLNTLNINRTLFGQNEYPSLKEFFAQIVSKQKEQIVLKKI